MDFVGANMAVVGSMSRSAHEGVRLTHSMPSRANANAGVEQVSMAGR
jgi:hypothetical protein